MTTVERRNAIKEKLASEIQAVSASALAAEFSVSRQVIVGDIAILRSSGLEIDATPRGYVLHRERQGIIKTIVCLHEDFEKMTEELNIMVDYGCSILNVMVEHPVYGNLTGELNIDSRYDVELFIKKNQESDAVPLSSLTGGIHAHTVLCGSLEGFNEAVKKLKEKGILISEGNIDK